MTRVLSGFLALACFASVASAEESMHVGYLPLTAALDQSGLALETPRSGVHRHDGFLLRLTLGPGAGLLSHHAIGSDDDTGFAGLGWGCSLDVGSALGDNWALFARGWFVMLIESTAYGSDGNRIDTAPSDVRRSTIGVGVSYFLLPWNLYLGGVVGLVSVAARYSRPGHSIPGQYTGAMGIDLELEIGKEWWVSDNWGLGIAARVSFDALGDIVPDEAIFGPAFASLLLSATYQ